MCEFESKLIAWIDGEMDPEAAHELELHLESCGACSAKAARYRDVSRAFAAYFDLPANSPRPIRRAALAGLSAAAAVALIVWALRTAPATLSLPEPKLPAPPAIAFLKGPAIPVQRHVAAIRDRSSTIPAATADTVPIEAEPTIEIAIPADAMFPPGAFPTGFAFAADLSIRGDGSPEALRVRPATYLK